MFLMFYNFSLLCKKVHLMLIVQVQILKMEVVLWIVRAVQGSQIALVMVMFQVTAAAMIAVT